MKDITRSEDDNKLRKMDKNCEDDNKLRKMNKNFCLKEVAFPPKPGFAETY